MSEPVPPVGPGKRTRKKLAIIGGSVLALMVIGGIAGGDDHPEQRTATQRPTTTTVAEVEEATTVPAPVEEATTAPPIAAGPITAPPALVVSAVVDGDTVNLDNGERVRLVGIDAPEVGACGAEEATAALSALVLGQAVTLEESDEDRDRYGRLLRYVVVDGVDAGGQLLTQGLAIPRYNSTDGYGLHPREGEYFAIAQPLVATCTPPPPVVTAPSVALPAAPPAPVPHMPFPNCAAARAAGAAPVLRGDPGYGNHLDRDSDGVGCES